MPTSEINPSELCVPILRGKPFTAEGWLFELKHDGFRAFVRRDRDELELLSRNGLSMARAFPEIVTAAKEALPNGVFDGELVVPDSYGRSDFGKLQRRSRMRRLSSIVEAALRTPAALIVFDVLAAGGADLRHLPLTERKEWLEKHVQRTGRPAHRWSRDARRRSSRQWRNRTSRVS